MKIIFRLLSVVLSLFIMSCAASMPVEKKDQDFNSSIKYSSEVLKFVYEKEFAEQGKKKLAVINFTNENGDYSVLGKFAANTIQPGMFSPKLFNLLERDQIESMLQELKFNQTGLVKTNDAKEVGKMAGADLVLVGSLAVKADDTGRKSLIVTSKIVDVESSEVKAISNSTCLTNEDLIKSYNELLPISIKSYAGAYKISIKNLVIKKTKSNNEEWDGDASAYQPDVYVSFRTLKSENIFSENFYDSFNVKEVITNKEIILNEEDNITIAVLDKDVLSDDLIGKTVVTGSKIMECIRTKAPIKLSFDQVESVEIWLEKI